MSLPKTYYQIGKEKVFDFLKNHSITKASREFQVPRQTIYNWNKSRDKIKLKPGRKSKLPNITKVYIKDYIKRRKFFRPDKISRAIYRKFGITICIKTIYNNIHKLGYSLKKLETKIYPKEKNNKKLVKSLLKRINKLPVHTIISIDESSFNHNMTPNRGWSLKGKRCVMHLNKTNNNKRYSMVCAISNNKIICQKVVEGSVNGEIFLDFMVNEVIPKTNNCYYLMDNARIHHYTKFKQWMEENCQGRLIYNIPYNPSTNPIEMVFGKLKSFVKERLPGSKKKLMSAIKYGTNKISSSDLRNYYKHAFSA